MIDNPSGIAQPLLRELTSSIRHAVIGFNGERSLMDMREMLQDIASEGGYVVVGEDFYHPYDVEAKMLGLIEVAMKGGGFSTDLDVVLTSKGRRFLGLPVETPAPSQSLRTKSSGFPWGS